MGQARGTSTHSAVWLAMAGLLILFTQTLFASRQLSLTYDEPIYTAIGYSDWATGDMRWHGVIGHPPLVNLLSAWPLFLGPTRPDPTQIPGWGTEDSLGFSRALLVRLGTLDQVALVTRLPIMWLALLLAAFVYRWAQRAWGGAAGLLALGLFVFDPNIVAHAQLNTTDMGVTAFGFMGCYALVCSLECPSAVAYVAAGVGLGAALASKASGPFWPTIAGLLILLRVFRQRPGQISREIKSALIRWIGLLGLSLLVLWAAYGFEVQPLTPGGLPIPAASYWAGLPYIRSYLAAGQNTFLAGRLISGHHWGYFPLALLIKTPLATWFGLLLAVTWSLRHRVWSSWSVISLLVVPVVYLAVAMATALHIGYRHLLPLLPFLFVFIAQLAGEQAISIVRKPCYRIAFGLLLMWYAVGTVRIFPHYLTYFNELVGGPNGGYRYLADSSVDWGQALKALSDYLDRHHIETYRLSAFSSLDPALYGLRFEPLPPTVGAPITLTARFNPEPGTYVISAVPLQGIWVLDPDTYDWFRHRQPADRVGRVFFVYHVSSADPVPQWLAQCARPSPLLDAGQIAEGFGRSDLRVVTFDCEEGWLYPAGEAGWVVLPGTTPSRWALQRLAGAPLSFSQREFWSHPALSVYEQRGLPAGAIPPQTSVRVAPSDWPPDKAWVEGTVVTAPVNMVGPLTFLGYDVQGADRARPGQTLELHTYWRINKRPGRPLSLMAHLLATDGTPIAVADGLSVPIEMWQSGDVIVQRHCLTVPPALPTDRLGLQTGAYWLDTLERWPVVVNDQIAGDRLLLTVCSRQSIPCQKPQ